jgi:hypothetical protein
MPILQVLLHGKFVSTSCRVQRASSEPPAEFCAFAVASSHPQSDQLIYKQSFEPILQPDMSHFLDMRKFAPSNQNPEYSPELLPPHETSRNFIFRAVTPLAHDPTDPPPFPHAHVI